MCPMAGGGLENGGGGWTLLCNSVPLDVLCAPAPYYTKTDFPTLCGLVAGNAQQPKSHSSADHLQKVFQSLIHIHNNVVGLTILKGSLSDVKFEFQLAYQALSTLLSSPIRQSKDTLKKLFYVRFLNFPQYVF